MKCAQRAIDEGDRRGRGLGEEEVVVAANCAIPCGKLRWREVGRVAGLELPALDSAREPYTHVFTRNLKLTMTSAIPFSRRSSLGVPHLSGLSR